MYFVFCVLICSFQDWFSYGFDFHTGEIWDQFIIQLIILSYICYKLFIHISLSLIEKMSDTSCSSFILHSSTDKMFRSTKRDKRFWLAVILDVNISCPWLYWVTFATHSLLTEALLVLIVYHSAPVSFLL